MKHPAALPQPFALTSPPDPAAIRHAKAVLKAALIGTDTLDDIFLKALGKSPKTTVVFESRPTQDMRHALAHMPANLGWMLGFGVMEPTEPPYGILIMPFYKGGEEIGRGEHHDKTLCICLGILDATLALLERE